MSLNKEDMVKKEKNTIPTAIDFENKAKEIARI